MKLVTYKLWDYFDKTTHLTTRFLVKEVKEVARNTNTIVYMQSIIATKESNVLDALKNIITSLNLKEGDKKEISLFLQGGE